MKRRGEGEGGGRRGREEREEGRESGDRRGKQERRVGRRGDKRGRQKRGGGRQYRGGGGMVGRGEKESQAREEFSLGFRDGLQMGTGSTLLEVI